MEKEIKREYEEKQLSPAGGGFMLLIVLLGFALSIAAAIWGGVMTENAEIAGTSAAAGIILMVVGIIAMSIVFPVMCAGFKIVNPNEAVVLLFFGKYHGTIAKDGFFWVNPFCVSFNPASMTFGELMAQSSSSSKQGSASATAKKAYSKKISLKAITHNNEKQKINDSEGNPIEIGVVLIWKVVNTAKAVFNVEDYTEFISTQADAATRQVTRQFPYDVGSDDEKSLRGSSQEVSELLKHELQERVDIAGIEIIEARISHLAYAPEIASAMLQRQQASAVIAARQKIVDGAVGMVEMALEKLAANKIVVLDDERKAAMVSNLLVVLCGNKEAQPIVNSGSIY